MNAFKFGLLLRQKIAASVPDNGAAGDPDFNALRQRYAKLNLPAEAWQHAGLPHMSAEQLQGASARDIWHINQQFANAPQARPMRGPMQQHVRTFNNMRTFATNTGKRYNPVFAQQGTPGYKPPLSSIQGLPQQQPAGAPQPPAAPQPPVAPPVPQPRPPQPAPVPAANAANPGNPTIMNDQGQRVPVANANLAKGAVPSTQLLPPTPRR
jgi:hypothetical protein